MIRATGVAASGSFEAAAETVVLAYDDRHRRRMAMTGEGGLSFLLDLPEATVLQDGDGLMLEDGRVVRVVAAPEALVEISAESAAALVRIAWHLGNRHLPTEVRGERLRIRRDHVIEQMLRQLGAQLVPVTAPFAPEGGAYRHGAVHGHDHGHAHGHQPSHGHSREA